jgi:hypothetical protein
VEEQASRLSIARLSIARVLEDSAVAEPPAGQDGRPAGKPRPASPASVLPVVSGPAGSGRRRGRLISTKPGLNRYLRVTPGGLLRTDAARAKAEENLEGKYLLRTADPKLSPRTSQPGTSNCSKWNAAGTT